MTAKPPIRLPTFLGAVSAVGRVTLREILRDRILYNVLIMGAMLQALSYLGSRLTYVRSERILIDFGIAGLQLATLAVGILMGAGLLNRERERRTVWLALAHPISRAQFITGKFAGLAAGLLLNSALLALFLCVNIALGEGHSELNVTTTLAGAIALSFLQAAFASAIAMFFSSFATTSVSIVLTTGVYLIGSSLTQVQFAASRAESELGKRLLGAAARVFPNFESFHLGTQLTYGLPVSSSYFASAALYAILVTLVALILTVVISERIQQ